MQKDLVPMIKEQMGIWRENEIAMKTGDAEITEKEMLMEILLKAFALATNETDKTLILIPITTIMGGQEMAQRMIAAANSIILGKELFEPIHPLLLMPTTEGAC